MTHECFSFGRLHTKSAWSTVMTGIKPAPAKDVDNSVPTSYRPVSYRRVLYCTSKMDGPTALKKAQALSTRSFNTSDVSLHSSTMSQLTSSVGNTLNTS